MKKNGNKNYLLIGFWAVLCALLFVLYGPSLNHPPRSDHISILYFFHHIDCLPGTWLNAVNYDPWTQVRFYPLAHLIVYAQFLVFGANFAAAHFFHMGIYVVSLICLYRFSRAAGVHAIPALACIGIFAFLYSHSDIAMWGLHTYIIIAFICMLSGFDLYARFVKTGTRHYMYTSGFLFIAGMLCYETFALWPLGIFFLARAVRERHAEKTARGETAFHDQWRLLASVYGLYLICFFLTRSLKTYDYSLQHFLSFASAKAAVYALVAPLGFLSYNTVIVNMFPMLAWPPRVYDEVYELAGLIVRFEPFFKVFLSITAIAGLAAVMLAARYLSRLRDKSPVRFFSFLFFLYYSELFVLFLTRSITNPAIFIFQQFRYQMVPNAILVLAVSLLVSVWSARRRKRLAVAAAVISIVTVINVVYARGSVMFVDGQIRPLTKLAGVVAGGLSRNQVSASRRLYIDDSIVNSFPPICWNRRMGSQWVPEGTIQWIYPRMDIKAFSFTPEGAYWRMDPDTLEIQRSVINK